MSDPDPDVFEAISAGVCWNCPGSLVWELMPASHGAAKRLRCTGQCLNTAVVTDRELRSLQHEPQEGAAVLIAMVWRRWNGEERNPAR